MSGFFLALPAEADFQLETTMVGQFTNLAESSIALCRNLSTVGSEQGSANDIIGLRLLTSGNAHRT
ncbi:MAG: hypothetical protein M3N34_02280 [Pseudomonadota bacterium]|nr:hypothetical protein [Pseudomonadota bacterium]